MGAEPCGLGLVDGLVVGRLVSTAAMHLKPSQNAMPIVCPLARFACLCILVYAQLVLGRHSAILDHDHSEPVASSLTGLRSMWRRCWLGAQ